MGLGDLMPQPIHDFKHTTKVKNIIVRKKKHWKIWMTCSEHRPKSNRLIFDHNWSQNSAEIANKNGFLLKIIVWEKARESESDCE